MLGPCTHERPCVAGRKNPVGNKARIDRPCQRERRDASRTCRMQNLGAFVERRSRGEHIVNEQDTPSGKGLRVADPKRAPQVPKTF